MRRLTIAVFACVLVLGMIGGTVTPVVAAPTGATPSGYNMVGGPNGSDFGQAEAVFSWDRAAQQYKNVGDLKFALNSDLPDCPGYFAWFASPTLITLPAFNHQGDTHVCTLSAGWNLVGNPFSLDAKLPVGVAAWYWNTATADYQKVGQIATGRAAWIYEATVASITITAS